MAEPANTRADQDAECGKGALWQRIARAPDPIPVAADDAVIQRWLEDIAQTPAGTTIKRLSAEQPMLHTLLAALARGSPHLWHLVQASPSRLAELLEQEPEQRFERIFPMPGMQLCKRVTMRRSCANCAG